MPRLLLYKPQFLLLLCLWGPSDLETYQILQKKLVGTISEPIWKGRWKLVCAGRGGGSFQPPSLGPPPRRGALVTLMMTHHKAQSGPEENFFQQNSPHDT